MKHLITTTLFGFSALHLAQAQLQNLPDCAKPCASTLPSQCNLDVSCICSDSSWISGISCCISTKCSPSDQQKTLNVAVQLCDTVKVTLPSAASCPASTGATAGASSAVAGATAGVSSAIAGANTIASTAASAATNAVSGAQTAASGAIGETTSSSTGSLSTSTASTSSSATQASGAAQGLGTNMGAVGAAAVAALAFL
ncbi:hypothetical protein BDR22DRAFT_842557 [Usnea florida]